MTKAQYQSSIDAAMIVLSEASAQCQVPTAPDSSIQSATELARILGFSVYLLSGDRSSQSLVQDSLVQDPLAHVPTQPQPTLGIWIGPVPTLDRYTALYDEALAKNIQLLNPPDRHAMVQSCDRVYPKLREFLPALPANLPRNWANVRHQAHLRQSDLKSGKGRSFRLFFYGQTVLTYGFHLTEDDPLKWLTSPEEEEIFALALEAVRRLEVPFVAIDVGQQETGQWVVLETYDAQFAGLSHMPFLHFWYELEQVAVNWNGMADSATATAL